MATDSYSEIMEMQKRAMERAKNISRQEKQAAANEKNEYNSPYTGLSGYTPREPKHTSLPLNLPKREEKKEEPEPLSVPDPDRAMLLSVLLLLKNEGADELLILALLYILA